MQSKKDLSERDICTKYITPAIKAAGWDIAAQVREEVTFTDGRIYVKGNRTKRGKGNQLMSLCDQLEQHIQDSQHHAEDLMKSLVREIV